MRKQLKSLIERKICANREWNVNKTNLLRYFYAVYIFEEASFRFALLRLHHEDSLTRYYESKKSFFFFLTHTRFDIIYWFMRDSIVYKSVCVSMSHFCRSIIFHSTQNFFFSENSMHSEELTSSFLISRSWRSWIASIMRCLSSYVSSKWCFFACLEFWLYLLC